MYKNVHTRHCCKNCGCAYGYDALDKYCPVVDGGLPQENECGKNQVCGADIWYEEDLIELE